MTTSARRVLMAGAAAAVLSGGLRAQEPAAATLAVAGRANSAPWIASPTAASVAVSVGGRGGRRLGPLRGDQPRRRARAFGRAGAGEPRRGRRPGRRARSRRGWRCTARPGGAEPDVVVAWNAKRRGDRGIEVARSCDGGRCFGPAVALQSAGAAGDRGWHALALDEQGAAHVLWLDRPRPRRHPGRGERSQGGRASAQERARRRRDGADVELALRHLRGPCLGRSRDHRRGSA